MSPARPGAGTGLRVAVTVEQCWHRVPGGTATSLLSTLGALTDHGGVDLVGVAASHRHPPAPAFSPPIPVVSAGLPRTVLYESWHWLRWPPPTRATGPADAVWASGMVYPPGAVPVVSTVHDLDFLDHPGNLSRRGRWLVHRWWELTRRRAAVVVCPSQTTAEACERQGVEPGRLRVVPWTTTLPAATDAQVAATTHRHRLRAPYVLWVGTIEPRKNLPAVVRAWRRLHDDGAPVELVLVGPRGWHEDLDRLLGADRAGVHVLGFVEPGELAALYRGAVALCYPSRAEGFGLPVLEAMAQHTPVVTSVGTATAEVTGTDGDAGFLVEPDDVAAIARSLATLASDPAARARMGAAARARADTFSAGRTASGMVGAFVDAAGGR